MRLKFILRVFVVILVLLSISQLVYTARFTNAYSIADEYIKSTFVNNLMILVVLQFVVGAVLFLFIPRFLTKTLGDLSRIVKDISVGKFNTQIKIPKQEKEMTKLYENVRIMYNELKDFDELKRSKILEHRSRLEALYTVSNEAYLFVDLQGEVVSLSHSIREFFPDIEESINFFNITLGASSQKLKEYVLAVLEAKEAIEPVFHNMKKLELHFGLKSAVVRGQNLEILGFVFAVDFKGNAKKKDKKSE